MRASARGHRPGEWPLRCFPQLGQHRDVGKGRGKKPLKGKRDHSAFGGAGVESFCSEWEGERLRLWRRQAPQNTPSFQFFCAAIVLSGVRYHLLCIYWATRERASGGWIRIRMAVLGLVTWPNRSRVLLRSLEGLHCGMQESERGTRVAVRSKGGGDSARTGIRRAMNNKMSSQVNRSSLLGTCSVWGKESSSIIVGSCRLRRWNVKGANMSSSARVAGRCRGPA
jgi:hypothetical protein